MLLFLVHKMNYKMCAKCASAQVLSAECFAAGGCKCYAYGVSLRNEGLGFRELGKKHWRKWR